MRPLLLLTLVLLLVSACAPALPHADPQDMTGRSVSTERAYRIGLRCLESGRDDAAAAHFERVLADRPNHFMATVYLGLAQWFSGAPEATRSLWQTSATNFPPQLARELDSMGLALELLAHRLRARRAVADEALGTYPPIEPDRILVARFDCRASAEDHPNAPCGSIARALRERSIQILADAGFAVIPRDLARAYEMECGADLLIPQREHALRTARLLGARFLVYGNISPAPGNPDALRTVVSVMDLEPESTRRERLRSALDIARRELDSTRLSLHTVLSRLDTCDQALEHAAQQDVLDVLLTRRAAVADAISAANREGRLADAVTLVAHHEVLGNDIARQRARIRDFERTTIALELNLFLLREDQLRAQTKALRPEATRLRRAILALESQCAFLTRRLAEPTVPVRDAVFTVANAGMSAWPARLAGAVAPLLGANGSQLLALPADSTPISADLALLDQALAAWDDGEYTRACRLMTQADPAAPAPVHPGEGFDAMGLASLSREEVAHSLMHRVRQAAQVAGIRSTDL